MAALSNTKILITRPAHQSGTLIELLLRHDAEISCFPVIAINDCHRTAPNLVCLRRLNRYQLLIFISQNAVEYGLKLLRADGDIPTLPPVAAIGRSTAARLEAHGIPVAACPEIPSSEQLLETELVRSLPAASRTLIFRGRGGREALANLLKQRAIDSDYAEVYARIKPHSTTLSLDECPQLIMVTSRDSLRNLYELTHPESRDRLLDTLLLLGTETMLDLALELGFRQPPVIARSPLDQDMAAAAMRWRQTAP